MYTLRKLSAPGWLKQFTTIEALTEAFSKWTCQLCKDIYGSDLEGMRCSDCGCEYEVGGVTLDEPETDLEWLERTVGGRLA